MSHLKVPVHFFDAGVAVRVAVCLVGVLACGCTHGPVDPLASTQRNDADRLLASGLQAFERGNFESAIDLWRQSERVYAASQRVAGQIDAKRNQAIGYRALGMFEMAANTLQSAKGMAEGLGDHDRQIAVYNDLGAVQTLTRETSLAESNLELALAMAVENNSLGAKASILNNLGNLFSVEGQHAESIQQYRQCAELAWQIDRAVLSARAWVNAASAAVLAGQYEQAFGFGHRAIRILDQLPDTHDKVYLLVTIANQQQAMIQSWPGGRERLEQESFNAYQTAIQVATRIQDKRSLSYAWGGLGRWYEVQGQIQAALNQTRRAIFAAQQVHSYDSLYRWHWQAGRLLTAQGRSDAALAAYDRAIETLERIRFDVAIGFGNRSASFRQEVGPLYFQLADLLLKRAQQHSDPQLVREDLLAARETIERFKTAEMVDYFQDQCVGVLEARQTAIEQVSYSTAVIYPIMLPDRIELLVSFRDHVMRFTTPVGSEQFHREVHGFRVELQQLSTRQYLKGAQKLYQWLVAPVEPELKARQIDTLVFVPDGPLRLVPMAALHDGRQFLIQRYATAITPGLTLTDPQPLQRSSGNLLACGLSVSNHRGFTPLPHVPEELDNIMRLFAGTKLLNEAFSLGRVKQEMTQHSYSVVHIASHAKFGRSADDTLILMHDTELSLGGLEQLIRPARFRDQPVELLTLSACETAAGDDRTALGLAGIALKAGAHSAVATLWPIQDNAASVLLTEFYRQLQDDVTVSKAKALQRAQLKVLESWQYDDPYFWSSFLLIGNWL